MGFPFLKVSAAALTAITFAFGALGASVSLAQDNATPAATTAAPVAVATDAATAAVPAAAATTAATVTYPACPSAATAAATTAATAAATAPVSAAGTAAPTNTLPPTATANPNAAYLGIAAQQVQSCGAQVLDVRPGTGAEAAKLQVGDIVVAVDGTAISSLDQFRLIVQGHKPGDKITITYQRGGVQAAAVVTLGTVPPDTIATAAATAASTAAK